MRDTDSQEASSRLSRRQYAQALAGVSAAGIAGCLGGDDDDEEQDDGDDGDDGDDTGGPEGDAQRDAIRVHVDNLPGQANLNKWAASPNEIGRLWLTELSSPYNLRTGEHLLDGHSWDVSDFHPDPDVEEIEVPTIYTGYDVEEPYDIYEYVRGHDGEEPLTYWDGTEIDADALIGYERLWYEHELYQFDDTETFNFEKEGDYAIHYWRDRGEVEGQTDDPAPAPILQQDRVWSTHDPFHPDFTWPYVEQFEDAGTEEEANSINEDLAGDTVGFERFAEEGWGSGLYELDPDQIGAERAVLTRRDDHPNDHATIDEVHLRFAETDRLNLLATEGEIDLHDGIIQEGEGQFVRDQFPDHVQQLEMFLTDGSDQLLMNWNNEHLQNLWVRRAIVAATDFYAVGANGWGPDRSVPQEHHVFLSDRVAEQTFSEEFLDSLYTYPLESDFELAEEFMRNAGYTMDGDEWVDPQGRSMSVIFNSNTGIEDWPPAEQTIEANLRNFGIPVDIEPYDGAVWNQQLEPDTMNYGMCFQWGPELHPWNFYNTNGAWWEDPLIGSDPDGGNMFTVDHTDYSETDNHGRPFEQQIPTDVGSIEAPDEAGRQPDLQAAGIDAEEISLPELVRAIQVYGTGEEERQEAYRKCARYANYYVPKFLFHSYTWGVWGNVRDFNLPRGHPANEVYKEFGAQDYLTQAGVAQAKYDDEYPEP